MVERNPEFILKWADALESGEYKQGREKLRQGDKFCSQFCCFGVACELLGYKKRYNDYEGAYEYEHPNGSLVIAIPSRSMMRDIGVTHVEMHELTEENDQGTTFVEIASKLRKWVEEWSNPDGH